MKKVLRIFVPAVLTVLSAGCMGDLQYEAPVEGPVTRTYALNFDVPTKTALGTNNRSVSWVADDQIYYYTDQTQSTAAAVRMENGIGYLDLTLSGPDDIFLNAFYSGQSNTPSSSIPIRKTPAPEQLSFVVSDVAPEEQQFRSFAEAHACAAHLANLKRTSITFRSLVSIFKFTLDDSSVKKVVFSSPDPNQIINGGYYGMVQVDFNSDGTLASVGEYNAYGDYPNSIIVHTDSEGEYYFSIIPSYFPTGFLLKCYDSDTATTPVKEVEYKKSLVAGIDAGGAFSPSIINLGSYSDWKTTEEPEPVYPVQNLTVNKTSLDFLVNGGAQTLTATVSGPAEANKNVDYSIEPDTLVDVVPSGPDNSGITTFTITPKADAEGSAVLTITTVGKDVDDNPIQRTVNITVSQPAPILPEELSNPESANCYIVSEATGNYMFKAVKGNTSESVGTVARAAVLWETRCKTPEFNYDTINAKTVVELPANPVIDFNGNTYICFTAKGQGSALIAALDSNDEVLWSWHIWVWPGYDQTVNFNTYSRGAGYLMDRDLGAENDYPTARPRDKSAYGLLYQWGRKDPFFGPDKRAYYALNGDIPNPQAASATIDGKRVGTVDYATAHPDVYILYSNSSTQDWLYTPDGTLWGTTKTVSDPCPPGWKVPVPSFWSTALGYTTNRTYNAADNSRIGLDFTGIMSSDPHVFYPATGGMRGTLETSFYASSGDIYGATKYGFWWTSGTKSSTGGQLFVVLADTQSANPAATAGRSHGYNVRCMWDSTKSPKGDIPVEVPVTSVSLTNTPSGLNVNDTFQLEYEVLPANASNKSVTWSSTNKSVATVSDTGLITAVGIGVATISATSVTNTDKSAQCLVTVGDPTQGGMVDLSADGGANSYIVYTPGTYGFKCKYKGNAKQESINPGSAQWLWQSYGTSEVGEDVITDVKLEGDYITFKVPSNMKDGNALIAAIAPNGTTVLWSWHIWVCAGFVASDYAQTYYNGAIVMDRNLGATSATPGDVRSFGLMYQWGRKDPFLGTYNPAAQQSSPAPSRTSGFMSWQNVENTAIGSSTTLNYAIQNPMHFLISKGRKDWMSDANPALWSGTSKTIYDPCPPGWMVPSGGQGGLWDAAWEANTDKDKSNVVEYNINSIFGSRYRNVFAPGTVFFPFAGMIWAHLGTYGESAGNMLKMWSGTADTQHSAYILSQTSTYFSHKNATAERSNGLSVRCVKESGN